MENETFNYRDYFHPGQRAMVELSQRDGKVLNDGAVVTAVEENRISLRLTRENLPEGALLQPDVSLAVRVGGIGYGYSCELSIIEEPPGAELMASFAGPVVPQDTREFFRLGTDLPVVLFNVTAGTAEENGFGGLSMGGKNGLPRIVNLSGGGLRTETEMAMTVGDIVYATFHLPLAEPKIVPVVAQVVYSEIIESEDGVLVSAGLSLMHINERDRDAIVRYVCSEEINRIRLCRQQLKSCSA
ncbi:PilZ-like domain-containing protein [Geomonas sp.]|uniref:PilZ-like domain-containing protein n=1 Tax=Geomonas sp. TaxID=2651584 RepID=UPI002B47C37C|nr:PilZ-like domain-containing protein [Geomonas sp.]HJV34418.1 PilZ-like domain-containing protein [Geomonas sp.]